MATATYSFRLTAEGFQAFAKDLEAVGNSSEEARRAIQTLIQSSPALAGALDKAMVAADKTRTAMTSAGTAIQTTVARTDVATRAFSRNTGQAFTQIGYQVGDFITQLQSGGNAFVAFGQQGSQLAGALLGGMAGLAVSIAAVAAQYVLAGNATKKATDLGREQELQLTNLTDVNKLLSRELETSEERQRRLTLARRSDIAAIVAQITATEQLQIARLRENRSLLTESLSIIEARRPAGAPPLTPEQRQNILGTRAREVQELDAEVQRLEGNVTTAQQRLQQLLGLGDRTPDQAAGGGARGRQAGGQNRTEEEAEQAFADRVRRGMEQAQQEADRVRSAYERVAAALDPAIAAQQRYNDTIKALDDALRSGFISQERYTELVGRAQQQLSSSGDDLEKAFDAFFSRSASAFEQAIAEGGSLRDVFKGLEQDIAKVILRLTVMEPLMSAIKTAYRGAGGLEGIFGTLFGSGTSAGGTAGIVGAGGNITAGIYHAGGTVGAGGTQRRVPDLAFVGAPRFHFGVDEVPAILKRGERVQTKEQAAANDRGIVYSPNIVVNVRDSNATSARIAAAVSVAVKRSTEEVAMQADRGGRYAQRVGRRQ